MSVDVELWYLCVYINFYKFGVECCNTIALVAPASRFFWGGRQFNVPARWNTVPTSRFSNIPFIRNTQPRFREYSCWGQAASTWICNVPGSSAVGLRSYLHVAANAPYCHHVGGVDCHSFAIYWSTTVWTRLLLLPEALRFPRSVAIGAQWPQPRFTFRSGQ